MESPALLIILTAFVTISAIAMVIQAVMLYRIHRSSRALEQGAVRLLPKIEALTDTSTAAIATSETRIRDITAKTSTLLDLTRSRLEEAEVAIERVASRAGARFDEADRAMGDVIHRTQRTVEVVQSTVLAPFRGATGVVKAMGAAFRYLADARRRNGDGHRG